MERESLEYQTRGYFLCRFKSGGGIGTGRNPSGIAAAITSQQSKANLPTHIPLNADSSGLAKDSVVLLEQVRTIDKKRLKEKMGSVDQNYMSEINDAISISFGLNV